MKIKKALLVVYYCRDCRTYFYLEDDTGEYCPKCGHVNIEVLYERNVRLLDLGLRREWEW